MSGNRYLCLKKAIYILIFDIDVSFGFIYLSTK